MRHHVGHRKLQRDTPHRLAMLKNMVTSLLEHEQIHTTIPKAKEARRLAERVITLGKRGGLHNVRMAQRTVANKGILEKVFGELKDRYATRAGGYTRILRAGFRKGDAAEIAILELVDRKVVEGGGATAPAPAESKKAEPKKVEAKAEKPPKAEKKVEAKAEKPKAEKKAAPKKSEAKPKAEKKPKK